MASRILAIGECMAELAPSDAAGGYRLGFAGDTFNTAWYLARLAPDLSVSYFTAVGQDKLSQDLLAFMHDSRIDAAQVREIADRTIGLYLISLDNGERSFSYWRGQSAARHMTEDAQAMAKAIDAADIIFFSGITLAILSVEARARLLGALQVARGAGKLVAFDPNLRPGLWASGAEMTDAIMQAAACCDLALPSFEDEATWFNDASPQATAARYTGVGARSVVVKNGAGPVHFVDGEQSGDIAVAALQRVTDTTAAGDSFNAGILAGVATDTPLDAAIGLSCRLAREVVQHKGALVPLNMARFAPQPGLGAIDA